MICHIFFWFGMFCCPAAFFCENQTPRTKWDLSQLTCISLATFTNGHVPTIFPFCRGNMSVPGSDQHHGRVPVWKAHDHSGAAANLLHDVFKTRYWSVICSSVHTGSLYNVKITFGHTDRRRSIISFFENAA